MSPPSDTIALTYLCGNRFRLTLIRVLRRDTAFRWATPSGDSGIVRLHRRLPGHAYTETIFATSVTDSVHIVGLPGSLRTGNGALPDCTPPRDTIWPTVNSVAGIRHHVDTSLFIVDTPGSDTVFGHTAYARPARGIPRDTIAAYLAQFNVRVSAMVTSGLLILRIDQAPADFSSYTSMLDAMEASSLFEFVSAAWLHEDLRTSPRSQPPPHPARDPARLQRRQ